MPDGETPDQGGSRFERLNIACVNRIFASMEAHPGQYQFGAIASTPVEGGSLMLSMSLEFVPTKELN